MMALQMIEMERVKYEAMFAIAFYVWLRISEVLSLRIGDLVASKELNELNRGNDLTYRTRIRIPTRKNGTIGFESRIYDDPVEASNVMAYTKIQKWLVIRKKILNDNGVEDQPDLPLFFWTNENRYDLERESEYKDVMDVLGS